MKRFTAIKEKIQWYASIAGGVAEGFPWKSMEKIKTKDDWVEAWKRALKQGNREEIKGLWRGGLWGKWRQEEIEAGNATQWWKIVMEKEDQEWAEWLLKTERRRGGLGLSWKDILSAMNQKNWKLVPTLMAYLPDELENGRGSNQWFKSDIENSIISEAMITTRSGSREWGEALKVVETVLDRFGPMEDALKKDSEYGRVKSESRLVDMAKMAWNRGHWDGIRWVGEKLVHRIKVRNQKGDTEVWGVEMNAYQTLQRLLKDIAMEGNVEFWNLLILEPWLNEIQRLKKGVSQEDQKIWDRKECKGLGSRWFEEVMRELTVTVFEKRLWRWGQMWAQCQRKIEDQLGELEENSKGWFWPGKMEPNLKGLGTMVLFGKVISDHGWDELMARNERGESWEPIAKEWLENTRAAWSPSAHFWGRIGEDQEGFGVRLWELSRELGVHEEWGQTLKEGLEDNNFVDNKRKERARWWNDIICAEEEWNVFKGALEKNGGIEKKSNAKHEVEERDPKRSRRL